MIDRPSRKRDGTHGRTGSATGTDFRLRTTKTTLKVASIGSAVTNRKAGVYEKRSTSFPTSNVTAVPARPAPKPLRPVTVPTTFWSNKSDGSVRPIVDQEA